MLYAVKGAPESVLAVCDRVLSASGETRLDETAQARWLARNEARDWPESLRGHFRNPAPALDDDTLDVQAWRQALGEAQAVRW